jgi:hypothetical protein
MPKRKFKPKHAIGLLLLITVGAALAAFFWLTTIETQIEYRDIAIDEVKYYSNDDMRIQFINGLSTKVPVTSQGSPNDQTVMTIYSIGSDTIDCSFVTLNELDCKDNCEVIIDPNEEFTLILGGDRDKCVLASGEYQISVFFGLRAPVSKEFVVQ